jgi:aspartate aminotransferase
MDLSSRIASVSASATIAITARAKEMKSEGIDVVSFGAGEPDFDTPDFIKDAAKAALDAGDTKYTPQKAAALLQAISDKLQKDNGLSYEPSEITMAFGGKNALYVAFQALLDPGQKVLIPAPYWVSYTEQVKLAGGEAIILPSELEAGFKITADQIRHAPVDARILVLNSPCNPTGETYTPDELQAIAQAVLERENLLVFSDEIYEKLLYGDTRFVSFPSLDDRLKDRTVIFNGLSKTYSMTGWRLGWAAGPSQAIGAMKRLMSHATTNPVSFAQAAALAAYTDPRSEELVEQRRREFEKRGKYIHERLEAISGVRCLPATGAFYVFPDVSSHYGRTLGGIEVSDSMTFAKAALEAAQVALVPGAAFGEDRCVRLSFAVGMDQIREGLDRIEKLLA